MIKYILICFSFLFCTVFLQAQNLIWKEDFENIEIKGNKAMPLNWASRSGTWTLPCTDFFIEKLDGKNVLKVHANKTTGVFMCNLSGIVDLKKPPILRWRWKALKLPEGADGRGRKKDDQAVAIYVGTGTLRYRAIAYRWETETPKGTEENVSYGTASIRWFCVRNKTDILEKWYVEEKNIADDFKKIYGFIPEKFVISIGGNSEYTGSETEAMTDWIEFVPQAPGLTLKN